MAAVERRALLLADGEPPAAADLDRAWPGWRDHVEIVVAADGGARLAEPLGLRIDAWVGDADSIELAELAELAASGVQIERASPDKDESDAELALLEAIRRGATDLTILGGLGGPRLDHGLANLALLAHPALAGRSARLLDAQSRVSLVAALDVAAGPTDRPIPGRIGDLVSLLPLGDVVGVTTRGLRYPLRDEPLLAGPARGLSNVREAADAGVAIRGGRLLIVETPAAILDR